MTKMTMEQMAAQPVQEELTYDAVIQQLQEARDNDIPVEEGILGAIVGGVAGMTMGPAVMKALCKILGVDEKGQFGQLLTSRLVLTALGAAMGWKK